MICWIYLIYWINIICVLRSVQTSPWSTSNERDSATPLSLRKQMGLASSKAHFIMTFYHCLFLYQTTLNSSVTCRMPDPDFSVSDVKLFVGKFNFSVLTLCHDLDTTTTFQFHDGRMLLISPPPRLPWQAVAGWLTSWTWPPRKALRCQWVSGGDTMKRLHLKGKSCIMSSAWSLAIRN